MHPLPSEDLDHVLRHTEGIWEPMRDQNVFMTGGTGFVGTWLLESLLWASDRLDLDVHVIVLTRDPDRFSAGSPHLADHRGVRLLRGDVVDFVFPRGEFAFVVHAATERIRPPTLDQPLGSFSRDEAGTHRIVEFASSHGTRRMLLTSSGAVYGRQPPELLNVPEDYGAAPSTMNTAATYAHAKRVSEFICAAYGQVHEFDVIIARLFAFVGPLLPFDANYAVGNFIRDALAGGPIRITGDGTPYRSYLYAADLAIWLWTLFFRGQAAFPYNVGSSEALSIAELAQRVMRALGLDVNVELGRHPVPDTPAERYVPHTMRAEGLGLRSLVPLEEGIRRTARWYQHRDAQTVRLSATA